MTHLLIIGGTGMLQGVAVEGARRGWLVSVIARRTQGLLELMQCAKSLPGSIASLAVDYTESNGLDVWLRKQLEGLGPATKTVAWIHRRAPEAPQLVAQALIDSAGGEPVDFVHVLSRVRTSDPRDHSVPIPAPDEAALRALPGLTYRQAILGWIVVPGGARWLTHDEIARGVIRAIDSTDSVTPIGRIDPIDSSPYATG